MNFENNDNGFIFILFVRCTNEYRGIREKTKTFIKSYCVGTRYLKCKCINYLPYVIKQCYKRYTYLYEYCNE